MKTIQLLVLIALLGLLGCNKDDKVTELDCSTVICTTEFRSITVALVNQDNKVLTPGYPYYLERRIEGSDELIEIKNELLDKFVIVDDSHKSILAPDGTVIIVKLYRVGFAGSDLINTSKYVIGHDCCHVSKISGPDTIKVD